MVGGRVCSSQHGRSVRHADANLNAPAIAQNEERRRIPPPPYEDKKESADGGEQPAASV